MNADRILIVRHGVGRGREPGYMRESLEYLRRRRPDLFQRLVFHATGGPPPAWDDVGAVVFWLGDPLREKYPACFEEAVHLADTARSRGLRLVNPPEALSNSIKSVQARLWGDAGLPTPRVERFENFDALKPAVGRLEFPLLVRRDDAHTQRGARVIQSPDELLQLPPAKLPFPCAVSALVDIRSGYRRADADTPAAQLFHKKRLIMANGVIRTKHVFFSENPIVSSRSCTFGQHRQWLTFGFHPFLSRLERCCIDQDLVYWRQAEEHRELMQRACEVLGLQFVAFDYSSFADGSIILWEANPYFVIPSLRQIMLPRYRLAFQRVESYHAAIGEFLERLSS